MILGPVAEAAHGNNHSSPVFDLLIGGGVLAISWFGLWNKEKRNRVNIWILIGISAICLVFIISGILALIR
jgi:hypothetical protein